MNAVDKFFENTPTKTRFPGGKPPRRPTDTVEKDKAVAGWDTKPTVKMLKGVKTEFFTVGALADALGLKPVTIRSWEAKGWLPLSRYRTQAPKNHPVSGKTPMGRRLYTRHQIEVVVDAAARAGVTDPEVRRPNWPQFTKIVVDGWKKTS
jgi:hypothetical protein